MGARSTKSTRVGHRTGETFWSEDQRTLGSGRKNQSRGVSGLLDTANTGVLGEWYNQFRHTARQKRSRMPQNRDAPGSRRGDKVLRFLDRAVIDFTVSHVAEAERIIYQTVRGVFLEGEAAFPGSKIARKSHIQIAVRYPACILEFFRLDPG